MLNISDLQPGTFIVQNGQPHQLIWKEHAKLGRGGAILRAKIKNLLTGGVVDLTFKGNEKVEPAEITRSRAQFIYKDEQGFNFMNTENFEQFCLPDGQIGRSGEFLKEEVEVDVLSWNGRPINIKPPVKVELKVARAEPAVRGNTAQGSPTKSAELETSAKINVPIFIKAGDTVRINTETGEYVERVRQ